MNIEQALRVLMGAFLVQGLLAIITWWPSSRGSSEAKDLVPFDAAEVEKITIHGAVRRTETPNEELVLEKGANGWTIPSAFGIEALPEKIEGLLEKIDAFEGRRPVAENRYSHADLDVAEDQRSRKLVIEPSQGEPVTLYLGSATGSAVHVRVDGDDAVYKIRGVTAYSIPPGASQYFDRTVVSVEPTTVDGLTVARQGEAPFTFTRTEAGWDLSASGPSGRTLDQTKAMQFVGKTLKVDMLKPVASTPTPEMGLANGTVVTWTSTEEGSTVAGRYVVGNEVLENSGRYYVQADGKPYIYEVLNAEVKNAREVLLDTVFSP